MKLVEMAKKDEIGAKTQPFALNNETSEAERHICAILQSVALEQAALAQILANEGEKMRNCMDAPCVEQILEMNRRAKETVDSVAYLELALHAKLSNCTL